MHFRIFFLILTFLLAQNRLKAEDWRLKERSSGADHQVTVDGYCEFLNAVATADPLGLYHERMTCIIRSEAPDSYHYEAAEEKEDCSITFVTQENAARYCEWRKDATSTCHFNCYKASASSFAAPDPELAASTSTLNFNCCHKAAASEACMMPPVIPLSSVTAMTDFFGSLFAFFAIGEIAEEGRHSVGESTPLLSGRNSTIESYRTSHPLPALPETIETSSSSLITDVAEARNILKQAEAAVLEAERREALAYAAHRETILLDQDDQRAMTWSWGTAIQHAEGAMLAFKKVAADLRTAVKEAPEPLPRDDWRCLDLETAQNKEGSWTVQILLWKAHQSAALTMIDWRAAAMLGRPGAIPAWEKVMKKAEATESFYVTASEACNKWLQEALPQFQALWRIYCFSATKERNFWAEQTKKASRNYKCAAEGHLPGSTLEFEN